MPRLFEHSVPHVRKLDFHPATRGGEPVDGVYRLNIRYKLANDGRPMVTAAQFDALKRAHGALDSSREGCHMAATIHPSGAVSGLRSNRVPECMALVTLVVPPKKLSASATTTQLCEIDTVARAGAAGRVRFASCPKEYQRVARQVVAAWSWNSWEPDSAS